MKYVVALDGRQSAKKTHNNQPKTGGRDGGGYGGEAQRAGGAGKRDIIVFWRGEVKGEVIN